MIVSKKLEIHDTEGHIIRLEGPKTSPNDLHRRIHEARTTGQNFISIASEYEQPARGGGLRRTTNTTFISLQHAVTITYSEEEIIE
jgi:hypothetical protein